MLQIEGSWDSIIFSSQSSVGEKLLWGILPLYEHAKWPSVQGSTPWKSGSNLDFKAELYYILKKLYTMDVSERTYFQTRLLWI